MTGALLTVRPGPVLHIWRDGQEVARVPLDLHGALTLAADLLAATARAVPVEGAGSFRGASCVGHSQAQHIPSRRNSKDVPPQQKEPDA